MSYKEELKALKEDVKKFKDKLAVLKAKFPDQEGDIELIEEETGIIASTEEEGEGEEAD